MCWSEIDLEKRLWTLPSERAKNNRMHVVPLSDAAIAILESMKSANLAVFEPVSFSRAKAELDKLLPGMPAWCVHDLRRTAASGMASLGVRIETVEKILNHASGSFRGIVGVYQKFARLVIVRVTLSRSSPERSNYWPLEPNGSVRLRASRRSRDLFVLYADRKLLTPAMIARIKTQFHLLEERTEVRSDWHYQSKETPNGLWTRSMRP